MLQDISFNYIEINNNEKTYIYLYVFQNNLTTLGSLMKNLLYFKYIADANVFTR